MSERIAILGFGGTIASTMNEHGALAPAKSAEELVEYAPGLKDLDAQFDVVQLSDKDSTDVDPDDWKLLISKVAELSEDYDGFVVTHGTDTMPYSSNALAFAFSKLQQTGSSMARPITFTGSQLPMVEVGSDGRSNLERAAKIELEAIHKGSSEIMIVFGDKVLRAVRTIKINESKFDAMASPAYPHLADITASPTVFSPLVRLKGFWHRSDDLHAVEGQEFDSGVVSMDVRPGLNPDLIRAVALSQHCSALILKSLGAGNVPSQGKFSLLPVIEETVASGRPVIIATKFVGGKTVPGMYEPGRKALESGAGHAGNMTDVAAEVKLMWLIGQGVREPKAVNEHMLYSYVGEVD